MILGKYLLSLVRMALPDAEEQLALCAPPEVLFKDL